MNTLSFVAPLEVNGRVNVVTGCSARGVRKGQMARIVAVEALGADYSHMVRVTLRFQDSFSAKTISFYARHANRLGDVVVGMNDGNPLHRITVRRA